MAKRPNFLADLNALGNGKNVKLKKGTKKSKLIKLSLTLRTFYLFLRQDSWIHIAYVFMNQNK